MGSEDSESIITRNELEQKTSQWLLKEDAASAQAFDKAAHTYLKKLNYKLYKYQQVLCSEAEKEKYLRLKRHLQNNEMSLSSPQVHSTVHSIATWHFPALPGKTLLRVPETSWIPSGAWEAWQKVPVID